jgi:hypothetical protein
MDAEIQRKLREKFDENRIGKKPKITCPACSKAKGVCGEHKKVRCPPAPQGCGQWISERHMHVDFVGHADVTDRLLDVDPEWDWEPLAVGDNGLPVFDQFGGLWIRLTIGGKTRVGYGGADGKGGEDAVKEAIGDAIKVTAMRFGVGLDLWRKGETPGKPAEDAPTPQQQATPPARRTNGTRSAAPEPSATGTPPAGPVPKTPAQARAQLAATCKENGWDLGRVAARFESDNDVVLGDCTDRDMIVRFRASLFSVSDSELRGAPAEAGTRQ